MTAAFEYHTLLAMQTQAEIAGRQCVVGAVVINVDGRAFVQKRSASRRLFPGCWDLIGGHVEPGETLEAALRREIREETGWELSQIVKVISEFDWETEQRGRRHEIDFLVQVDGDLEHPQIEWSKNSEFRWIGLDEIDLLKENRQLADIIVYEIVKMGLEDAASPQ